MSTDADATLATSAVREALRDRADALSESDLHGLLARVRAETERTKDVVDAGTVRQWAGTHPSAETRRG